MISKRVWIIIAMLATMLLGLSALAQSMPQAFSFNGQVFDTSNNPVTSNNVDFLIEIKSADGACTLYRESQLNLDLSGTQGVFALSIGTGTSVVSPNASMSKVFSYGSPLNCIEGGTQSPSAYDGRQLLVSVSVSGGAYDVLSAQTIQSVPFALAADNSQKLQGKLASDLIQVNTATTNKLSQANAEAVFQKYDDLMAILLGTTTLYVKNNGSNWSPTGAVNMNGQTINNVATPSSGTDAVNKNYADARIGGSQTDLTGVGSGLGNGKTLIWNASTSKWETGIPTATDNTKLPLSGGIMTGPLQIGSNNYLRMGNLSDAQESSLSLTASNIGATWYNTTSNKMKYWDGTTVKIVSNTSGAVTDVTATAPLISSGGPSPDISLSFGNGLQNTAGVLLAKAGTGIVVNSTGINVDVGTAANQLMVNSSIPNCTAAQKLQMSLGPTYSWSCVTDLSGGSPTGSAGGSLAGTYPNPTIAAGAIGTTELASGAVSYAKIQNVSATNKLLGRATAGAGVMEELALGTGLSFTSGTLNVGSVAPTGAAGGDLTGTYPNPTIASGAVGSTEIIDASIATGDLANTAVTYAKIQNVSATNKLLGRATAGAGVIEELALGTGLSFTSGTLNASGGVPSGSAGGSLAGTYPNPTIAAGAVGTTELASSVASGLWTSSGSSIYRLSGNVSIGSVPTSDKLNVTGNIFASSQIEGSQFKSGSGSVSAPAYTPGADTLTGMWFPATSVIAFSTAMNERMRIDSSGKVGIGGSSTGSALHVQNASPASPVLLLKGASGQTGRLVEVQDNSGTSKMYVDNSGNLFSQNLNSITGSLGLTSTTGGVSISAGSGDITLQPTMSLTKIRMIANSTNSGLQVNADGTGGTINMSSNAGVTVSGTGDVNIQPSSPAKIKLGSSGSGFSNMGACTVTLNFPTTNMLQNGWNTFTCSGIPQTTNVAIYCSAPFLNSGDSTHCVGYNFGANTILCGNTKTSNTYSFGTMTCMWMQP